MADDKEKETQKSSVLRNNVIPVEKDGSLSSFLKERGFAPPSQDSRDIKDVAKKISDFHVSFLNKSDKILKGVGKSVSVAMSSKKGGDNDGDRREKANPVTVVGFSEKALEKLNTGKKTGEIETGGEEQKTNKTDFLTKLFTAAVPLLMIGGAWISLLKEMFSGGPLQGIMNMLSKFFTVMGDALIKKLPGMNFLKGFFAKGGFVRNILAKVFGKGSVITKVLGGNFAKGGLGLFKGVGKAFLKRLPIIGSLISLGSAFKRVKDGDVIGGLIDVGAAIAYMFPFVGTGIGIALDVLNASMDVGEANPQRGGVLGFMGKLKGWLDKNKRNLPIIGPITRLGEAFGYLSVNDFKNFFKGLMGAGAATIPGLGYVYDLLFGSVDPEASDDEKEGMNIGKMISNLFKFIKGFLGDKIKKMLEDFKNTVEDFVDPTGRKAAKRSAEAAKTKEMQAKSSAVNALATGRDAQGNILSEQQVTQAIRIAEKNNLNVDSKKIEQKIQALREEQAEDMKNVTEALKKQTEAMEMGQNGNITAASSTTNNTQNNITPAIGKAAENRAKFKEKTNSN